MEKWQEELTQCLRSVEDLEHFLPLKNKTAIFEAISRARMSITPHTASLIDWQNPQDPLFLISVPRENELNISDKELDDPLGEKISSPIPFLTRKYSDRVIITVSFVCPQYCRFCFRRDRTGCATEGPSVEDREQIRQYLINNPEIKEVILSGGEPLLLTDNQLSEWLKMIDDVGCRIRIHSRVPVTLPSRITSELVKLLSDFKVTIITHFNHPKEIAPANIEAIKRLVEAGLIVKNQSVLLRGVNSSTEVLSKLINRLVELSVKQHAIHQLDLAKGTNHFRVPLVEGIKIVRGLGELAPPYYLDMPDGRGKVNVLSSLKFVEGKNFVFDRNGELLEYSEVDVIL